MEVEKFRGYVTALVAAVLAIGAPAMAAWAWAMPATEPPRDLSILFGLIGVAFGGASAWLFGQESAARATHAAERSFSSGQFAGQSLPEQANGSGTVSNTLTPAFGFTAEPVLTVGGDRLAGEIEEPDAEPDRNEQGSDVAPRPEPENDADREEGDEPDNGSRAIA